MSIKALQSYTFHSKYARYNPELKRRDTWNEAIDRVLEMHLTRYPQIADELNWAFEQSKAKRVLGSQRALQYAGAPALNKHARVYNCFGSGTTFVTTQGVESFVDHVDGDCVVALTHTGAWKPAVVRNHGQQPLNTVTLKRGRAEHTVSVTSDHRWLLKDGTETTNLKVGDELMYAPNLLSQFDYDEANPMERLYWSYGFVYGNGTKVKNTEGVHKYSMVRLCGDDVRLLPRFQELGFADSSSLSLQGDVMVYTGSYLKTLPDLGVDSPALIRAFVRGYLDAGGEKNTSNPQSPFLTIQATGKLSIDFIRKAFPVAGVYIVSEMDLTGQETNFGAREETIKFRVISGFGQTAASFRVESIVEQGSADVWCLEVEDDHSFVLPFGISTGNCTVSYCDRIRFFQEAFWLLLCGSGVGFSVQQHHIAKLPDFLLSRLADNTREVREFVIPDSIEGWADALGVLLATYFPHAEFSEWNGLDVEFNFDIIRPKGSKLSSGVGKAPGAEPLKKSLEAIRALLDRCVAEGQTRLRSIDAYDAMMHASDAVLSGGVRRSATICIFSPEDDLMAQAKTGDWYYTNPQRGRSNNSVLLVRSETSRETFHNLLESVRQFGEPGFVWSNSTEMMYNPCITKNMWTTTTAGPKQVKDLIGVPFVALVDGEEHISTNKGFFPTGVKPVFSLLTSSGYQVEITGNHQVLIIDHLSNKQRRTTWKTVDKLVKGDRVVLHNHRNCNFSGKGGFKEGWLLGNLKGDGSLNSVDKTAYLEYWGDNRASMLEVATSNIHATIGARSDVGSGAGSSQYNRIRLSSTRLYSLASEYGFDDTKTITSAVESTSSDFHRGFLQGWFDADGSVQGTQEKGISIRLSSIDLVGLQAAQRMLARLGIISTIYLNRREAGVRSLPNGRNGYGDYFCQASHDLVIANDNLAEFASVVGFKDEIKQGVLMDALMNYKRGLNRERFFAEVESISYIGEQEVFDCTIPTISAFDANGLYIHNCVEIGMYPVDSTTGLSGWAFCNLCEINGKKCKTKEDFAIAARAAAIIGTAQAGYTDFDYLGVTTKNIAEREALLGVSITGMMDSPDILFDPETQREMAALVVSTNKEIAAKIGIRQSARCTCVKPAGCQRPDTLVVSNKGIFMLGELGDVKGEQWQPHDLDMFTGISKENSPKFFVNGVAPTKRISLSTGLELEATHNHRYQVLRNGVLDWVRADEIVKGDLIPYALGGYTNSGGEPTLQPLQDKHFNSGWVRSPEVMNPDLAWFIGLYTGDGSNHRGGVRVHGNSEDMSDLYRAADVIKNQFELNPTVEVETYREGHRATLVLNSRDFLRWLKLNGLSKAKSAAIEVPLTIRQSSTHSLTAFVDGYCDADGCLKHKNGTRIWNTISKKMATQLVVILRALGVDSVMGDMPPTETSKGNTMRYRIQEKRGWKGQTQKSPMRLLYAQLTEAGLAHLSPDVVTNVEDSESMTLDIEVPKGNAYVANSYISHNTTSCILGTSSGIHAHHSKRYIRRVQANMLEAPFQFFQQKNPRAVEKSVWSKNGTDGVISFCIDTPEGARTRKEVGAIKLLEIVSLTQNNWVAAGRNPELCVQPYLRHNVSNTINVKPTEWEEVEEHIYNHREDFAGISLLSTTGDLDYPQAPFVAIHTPAEIVKMYGDGSLMASGLIVDGLARFNDNLWLACDYVTGINKLDCEKLIKAKESDPVTDSIEERREYLECLAQADWIRRAHQFSDRYFGGDRKLMTYCLKEVHNWKYWCDLQREYVDVEYKELIEEEDNTKIQESVACAGGVCELTF